MGMTDKQFNDFLKFLLDDLKEIKTEENKEKQNEKIDKIIDDLQNKIKENHQVIKSN